MTQTEIKPNEFVERNQEIVRMARREVTYQEIADLYGISKARAQKIASDAGVRKNLHTPYKFAELGDLLNYIIEYKTLHDGNSPTFREIGQARGISSTSVVAYLLQRLEKGGKIKLCGKGEARTIMVVGGRWSFEP